MCLPAKIRELTEPQIRYRCQEKKVFFIKKNRCLGEQPRGSKTPHRYPVYRGHHSAFIPFIDRISTRQSLKNYEKRMIARSLAVTSLQSFSCTDEKLRSCVLQFTNFESVQSVGGQASFNPKSYKYERIFEVEGLPSIRDGTVPPSLSHWSSYSAVLFQQYVSYPLLS